MSFSLCLNLYAQKRWISHSSEGFENLYCLVSANTSDYVFPTSSLQWLLLMFHGSSGTRLTLQSLWFFPFPHAGTPCDSVPGGTFPFLFLLCHNAWISAVWYSSSHKLWMAALQCPLFIPTVMCMQFLNLYNMAALLATWLLPVFPLHTVPTSKIYITISNEVICSYFFQ